VRPAAATIDEEVKHDGEEPDPHVGARPELIEVAEAALQGVLDQVPGVHRAALEPQGPNEQLVKMGSNQRFEALFLLDALGLRVHGCALQQTPCQRRTERTPGKTPCFVPVGGRRRFLHSPRCAAQIVRRRR
jgi:hypothetical protein